MTVVCYVARISLIYLTLALNRIHMILFRENYRSSFEVVSMASRKRSLDDHQARDVVKCYLCEKSYQFWYLKENHLPNEHGEKYIPPWKKGQCSVLSFWKKNEKVVYEGKRVDEKNDQIAGSSSPPVIDMSYEGKEFL